MSKPPVAKDYFLPEQKNADDRFYLGPIRKARDISALIDGDQIFKALEGAILGAKKNVLIAFWAFDPFLKLLTPQAKKFGGTVWGDLLFQVANNGVKVRILWNDFDAGFQHVNHVFAWARYRLMVQRAMKEAVSETNFQVVVARHEAEITADVVKSAGKAGAYDDVIKALEVDPKDPARSDPDKMKKERAIAYANGPGFWEKITFDTSKVIMTARKPGEAYPAYPAAYHQKFVIVDGKTAFAGGINLVDPNMDTRKHTFKADWAWHDAFITFEGEPIEDLSRNFIAIWNYERKRSEVFLKGALKVAHKNVGMPIGVTTDLALSDILPASPDKEKTPIPSQVQRTMTRKSSATNGVPDIIRKDVLDGYLRAIALAEKYIYIENQYFRETSIADAIIAQHKKNTALRTIILLPRVAEEFMKSKGDAISLFGAALQFEAFEKMQKEIGKNLGLFTAVVGDKETSVYIHSKLILIDDVYANLGSANANPRSFRMDCELNLAWYDKRSVKQLRVNLWNEMLGSAGGISGWKTKDFVDKWSAIAKKNQGQAAKKRKSFVIPFENKIQGLKLPIIPEVFT